MMSTHSKSRSPCASRPLISTLHTILNQKPFLLAEEGQGCVESLSVACFLVPRAPTNTRPKPLFVPKRLGPPPEPSLPFGVAHSQGRTRGVDGLFTRHGLRIRGPWRIAAQARDDFQRRLVPSFFGQPKVVSCAIPMPPHRAVESPR